MPENAAHDPQRTLDQSAKPNTLSTLDVTGAYQPAPDTLPLSSGPAGDLPSIPGYAITGEIARGGMGRVLAGRELALDREVAIKVLLPGAKVERFITESKITAKLPHPNIPPVHALGMLADGSPFLAMKLIRGRTLAAELGDRQTISADLPRFLQVFEQIAQAVGFAHSRGILHRDLKPLNVMVGEFGEVQVMDWGLARAVGSAEFGVGSEESETNCEDLTQAGAIMGTPAYMPPEQARGEPVAARADVFALGATLMEILTTERPWGSGSSAVVIERASRALLEGCHETLAQCPADPELVAVARKCLSADATDRYPDGRAVADAVAAYRTGVEQRLKQAETQRAEAVVREAEQRKRRRVLVWAGGIVVSILLLGVAGTGLGLFQAREAKERESARANGEEQAKEKAVEFRNKALDALRATTGTDVEMLLGEKKELTAKEKAYLEAIAQRWQTFAKQDGTDEQSRAICAEGHYRVACLWQQLGRRDEALPEFEQALVLHEKLAADFPADPVYRRELAAIHTNMSALLAGLGRLAEAKEQCQKGLALQEKLAADFPSITEYLSDQARSQYNLATLLASLGKQAAAEGQYKEGLVVQEKLAADFPNVPEYRRNLARSHSSLGILMKNQGKQAQAEQQYTKGLHLQEKLAIDFPAVPDYRSELARSHNNLGGLLVDLGKQAEAEEHYKKGLDLREKLATDLPAIPEYRSNLAESHYNLGVLLVDLGKRAEGEDEYRKALSLQQRLVADFPAIPEYRSGMSTSHIGLAVLLKYLGRRAEAEEHYKQVLTIREKLAADFPVVPEYRSSLAEIHYDLGVLLVDLGKRAEAEEQYRKGLTLREKLAADFPAISDYLSSLAESHYNLGVLLVDLGKQEEAEEQYRKGLALREKLAADFPAIPENRVDLARIYGNIGHLLRIRGKAAECLVWYDKAITILRPVNASEPQAAIAKEVLQNSHWNRAIAFVTLGKHVEAIKDWDKAIELSPKQSQPIRRANRSMSQLNAGMVAEAVAEVAELTKSPIWNADQWYDFACVYAVASRKVANKKPEYADRAMELLAKAVNEGYKDAANMKKDTDLDPLREREDFKNLLADLEAKFPPSKELAPSPRLAK